MGGDEWEISQELQNVQLSTSIQGKSSALEKWLSSDLWTKQRKKRRRWEIISDVFGRCQKSWEDFLHMKEFMVICITYWAWFWKNINGTSFRWLAMISSVSPFPSLTPLKKDELNQNCELKDKRICVWIVCLHPRQSPPFCDPYRDVSLTQKL